MSEQTKYKYVYDKGLTKQEIENAAMYAHSHKLTRFQLRDKLSAVRDKWKLHA